MGSRHGTLAERFWRHAQRGEATECWPWLGSRTDKGYGKIYPGPSSGSGRVHRISYELVNGPIPEGMDVCHTCDNPPCVNPGHLFLGTNLQNRRDMVAKQRQQAGERHYAARLSAEAVAVIRSTYTGVRGDQRRLAMEFGVSHGHISEIVNGRVRRMG